MTELVEVRTVAAGLTHVTLNRPEKRNALGVELMERLRGVVARLQDDDSQRVVVLRGAGPVFCAGLDLTEAADDALVERSAACVAGVLRALRETPLVTIACVRGGAFAGGAGMMAACDVVVAADDAVFGFPEPRRGLLPALIAPVLKHRVRAGDLREILLTGATFDAQRALRIGLVQHVVPAGQLEDRCRRLADAILAGGPETIRRTKHLVNDLYREASDGEELSSHLEARRSGEAREGLRAFREKRPPSWAPAREGDP